MTSPTHASPLAAAAGSEPAGPWSAFSLRGKAALITGASSGIGLHLATTLAQAGAAVALAARREDRLQQAVQTLRDAGATACAISLDVTQREQIEPAWQAAEQALGQPISILINNAGILYAQKFVDQDPAEIDRIWQTNFAGAMAVAQVAARAMIAHGQGGSIVHIASTSGLRAGGLMASYGASKAGLIHLSRIMALELAGKGVRVNAICPGNLTTDMHDTFTERGIEDMIRKRIPMRRFGEPSDLDGAVLLMASDAGRYITGATLAVDGGQTLSWI